MNRDNQTLIDLARSARLIIQFKNTADKTEFFNNLEKPSAILYQIMILGAAVKRLSPEFRNNYQDITWSLIAKMRDKIIHKYDQVNLDRVWQTINEDVPVFLAAIEDLLPRQNEF
jgi:uncharacterized protein with HEPN domain